MNLNELNEINNLIKETEREVVDRIEWMKLEYLHSLDRQKKTAFETFIYERTKIKLGCIVFYGSRQYYVTDLGDTYDHFRKAIIYVATLKEKCDKNYKDKRKWYSGENKVLTGIDVRLLTAIKEDGDARKQIIKTEWKDKLMDHFVQLQYRDMERRR